ncbi:hypothetical protein HNY73_020785 [Argiope bruennichi]|uniref:Uncharacterized protein n=1 Tax=Argiope bruennichi TaxID=94029 RepID=A0A8T0EBU7_ARGBR|nr:hypothetical protein HNY73_020785 [Argiope bruennichi]
MVRSKFRSAKCINFRRWTPDDITRYGRGTLTRYLPKRALLPLSLVEHRSKTSSSKTYSGNYIAQNFGDLVGFTKDEPRKVVPQPRKSFRLKR